MEKNKNIFRKISIGFSIISIILVFVSGMLYDGTKGPSGQTGLTLIILRLFAMYWRIITNPIFLLLTLIISSIYISKNKEKEINITALINILATSLICRVSLNSVFCLCGFYDQILTNVDEPILIVDKTGDILLTGTMILVIEFIVYLVVDNRITNKNKIN